MRRVNDLGSKLLGDQREPGLLPRQPGRTVRDRSRSGNHHGLWRDQRVTLGIGTLADDGEIGTGTAECGEQAVDVAPNAPTVGGDGGRVDQHSGGHERLPPRLNVRANSSVWFPSVSPPPSRCSA